METQMGFVEDALCRQVDPELFFPEHGYNNVAAMSVCRKCPVQAECLSYAVERPELIGVWGGATVRQRIQMRKANPLLRRSRGPRPARY